MAVDYSGLREAGVDDGAVEDGGGETCDGWDVGCGGEVEDDDFVGAFAEPGAGDEEGLLRADVPEAADGVAVDPEGSFAEVADVEEGVAGGGEGEVGSVEGGGGHSGSDSWLALQSEMRGIPRLRSAMTGRDWKVGRVVMGRG